MALNIKTAADPVEVGTLITLIYGQPGIGKTSLAFTAASPLLLDFDSGAHRSGYRKDYVPVKSWSEVANIDPKELAAYRTVIIDTLGACLDRLGENIIGRNDRMRNKATGGLSLQGFGMLKAEFTGWVRRLKSAGCDIVMIAHGKEKTENDSTYIRPDIVGGSYDEIMKMADFVGYYYMEQGQGKAMRILDFSPTPRWIGKNSAGFPPLPVPHLDEAPEYLAHVLGQARDTITQQSEAQAKAVALIGEWRIHIEAAQTAAQVNELVAKVVDINASEGIQKQIKVMLKRHADDLGLQYDKAAGGYIAPNDESAA